VGPFFGVLRHPLPSCSRDIVAESEQVLVEDFLAEGPVEAFDSGVLVGLAGLDVLDGRALAPGP
jgi:hypothetical protein